MTYRISEIGAHGWAWEMIAANGKVLATSNQFYRTEGGAVRAVRRVLNAQRGSLWFIQTPTNGAVVGMPL